VLPEGVHPATWLEVELWFQDHAFPDRRLMHLGNLQRLCDDFLRPNFSGLPLLIGGSCFSVKQLPEDIECTIDLLGADQQIQMQALFHHLKRHDEIRKLYGVDYYPTLITGQPKGDFVKLFQYVGPKSAAALGLDEKDLRGLVRLEAW
jgi:hypothetical protein